jgi:hypothetical protein
MRVLGSINRPWAPSSIAVHQSKVEQPAADPPADPHLLAQPDRDSTSRSSLQRKALTPNDFDSLDERLLRGDHYGQIAQRFEWTFTRADLDHLLARIQAHQLRLALAA